MKQVIVTTSIALIAVATFFHISGAAEIGTTEKAIRQLAQQFAEAYNRGDANAVAAQWTEDGEYRLGNEKVKGRDKIAALYKEFFKAHPGSKMTVKVDSVRMLAPTVAIEEGTSSVVDSPNGPPSASTYTAIHVKQGEKWLMAGVRDSESPTIQFDRDLKELAWLAGEWTAQKDESKITLKCDWTANKHFLRIEISVHGKSGDIPGGLQIVGRNPQSGDITSWFFSADGGYGTGIWRREGSRWFIQTEGMNADGVPTAATNIIYRASDNVVSWQSTRRFVGERPLPEIKEVVIDRVTPTK